MDKGYDFSKLRTVKMSRKNNVAPFLFFIFLLTPLIIFSVFLALYISGTPMDVNDVIQYPGSQEYESFMLTFLLVTGGIALLFLILFFWSLIGMKEGLVYLGETVDLDKIIYFESKRKAIYITSKEVIYYDKKRDRIKRESSTARIDEEKDNYVFWLNLDKIRNPKIKVTSNKVIYQYSDNFRSMTLRKRYVLKLNDSGILTSFNEQVSTYRYGNSNIKAMCHYHIIETNYSSQIPYHDKIKKEIFNTF